jgi:hypothetical protein
MRVMLIGGLVLLGVGVRLPLALALALAVSGWHSGRVK